MPFREAHAVVGKVVRDALATDTPMVEITRTHPQLGEDAAQLFSPGVAVSNRRTPGAAGPEAAPLQKQRLADAIAEAKKFL
jgi:argininosuccinate lyase